MYGGTMIFLIAGIFLGGYLAFTFAKKWPKWWGALLAVPASVLITVLASFAIAALLSSIESSHWTDTGLILSATLSLWSIVSAPIGAFIGWRKQGQPSELPTKNPVQPTPGAFDNLKR